MSTLAHEAAIAGDTRAARDLFRQAAQRDPTDEDIAYHLARSSEELGDGAGAVEAYCQYLALAERASDTTEVRARIVALSSNRSREKSKRAAAYFRSGLEHYDRGRRLDAVYAFTNALVHAPDWADAYYNRALAYGSDDKQRSTSDLRKYLELRPEAPDRDLVLRQIRTLQGPGFRPSTALGRGLALPGLGQFYTDRPALGVAVMAGVVGAVVFALQTDSATETRSFVDRYGNRREFTVGVKERPYLVAGTATAVAIAVGAAFEAFLYARRSRDADAAAPGPAAGPQREASAASARPVLAPSAYGTRLGVALRF